MKVTGEMAFVSSCGPWQPFQVRNEGYFPERWQGRNLRHFGNLKDLRNTGTAGKAVWQLWIWLPCFED